MMIKFDEKINFESSLSETGIKKSYYAKNKFVILTSKIIQIVNFLGKLFKISPEIKGWKIGKKTTEYGLQLGDLIVAFGKIIFDK